MYNVISNPTAGKKGNKRCLDLAIGVFKEAGAEFKIHETTRRGEAREIARKLTEAGEKQIVVVGGDGTLHEVLNGIANPTECKIGLIPAGTGNDFADAAKIPMGAEEAARLILKGETKATDYLELGGVRCMNIGGMGIDVDILERCQKGRMKGKLKYLISLLRSVLSYKGWDVRYEKDGETVEKKVLVAAVCNGVQFGGGLKICPEANIGDGLLNVVIVEHIKGLFNLAKAFTKLMKGKITEYPLTTQFLCENIRISAPPCTVQLDGELYQNLTFEAKVCKGLEFYR